MKGIRSVLVAIAVAAFSLSGRAQEIDPQTVNRLVESIRSQLPAGWQISLDENHWIRVKRAMEVELDSTAPNGPPVSKSQTGSLSLDFQVVPYLNAVEYLTAKQENEVTHGKMATLSEYLRQRQVGQKFDQFVSNDPQVETEIARYEALKKSIRILPSFFFGNIGVDGPFITAVPRDEAVQAEFDEVKTRLVAVLSPYDASALRIQ